MWEWGGRSRRGNVRLIRPLKSNIDILIYEITKEGIKNNNHNNKKDYAFSTLHRDSKVRLCCLTKL